MDSLPAPSEEGECNSARADGPLYGSLDVSKASDSGAPGIARKAPRLLSWSGHLSSPFLRLAKLLGFPPQHLASQREFSRLAEPFYDPRVRGGEGHLEVAKTLYYTQNKMCHMVLALKPFGCLPRCNPTPYKRPSSSDFLK